MFFNILIYKHVNTQKTNISSIIIKFAGMIMKSFIQKTLIIA
jgi:hypothetical protein